MNLASVTDRAGGDTFYINALNPSVIRRRETSFSGLIKFDESHMQLRLEHLITRVFTSIAILEAKTLEEKIKIIIVLMNSQALPLA